MKFVITLAVLAVIFGTLSLASSQEDVCSPPHTPCMRNYAPVCGVKSGVYRTFGNRCVLNGEPCRDGWRFYAEGECA